MAVNGYLLYLSSQFYRDPGNQNARKVFKCSLWYLPVMMTAMIVHKKEWTRPGLENTEDESLASGDFLSGLVPSVKAAGAAACPHERIIHSLDGEQQQQQQQACPAIVAREAGAQVGVAVTTSTASSATLSQ